MYTYIYIYIYIIISVARRHSLRLPRPRLPVGGRDARAPRHQQHGAHRRPGGGSYTILYELYYAMIYYTIVCYNMVYYTIPYHTILYYNILYIYIRSGIR